MDEHEQVDLYARLLAIVQSSGMGKSRMIDELAKNHFVIPLNLRSGFEGENVFTPQNLTFSNAPGQDTQHLIFKFGIGY